MVNLILSIHTVTPYFISSFTDSLMHDNVETHMHEIINKGATCIKASNVWAATCVRISKLSHLHKIMQLDKFPITLNCSYS